MTENVRVRVSKWDLPDESHVSGGFAQGNDELGIEGNCNIEKCIFDRNSAGYAEGHALSLSNAGGDKTCSPICRPGSESNAILSGSGSEFSNYPIMDQSETGKKDDIPWGPIVESKTELEGSIIKNSRKSNLAGVDPCNGDELWHNINENKVSLTGGNTEKINSDWVPISSTVELEDGNVNNPQSVKCSDVDFVEKEKLLLTSDENKDGVSEGNDENRNSGWSPIPGKDESEDGNVNNMQNTKFSDVNIGDSDKSWQLSSENEIDHNHDNNEKMSGWGTSLGHIDKSSTSVRGWHRGSSPPKISGGSYRCQSRSRSRSRSPTQVHRREDKDRWNDGDKSGPVFYRGPCRDFMAGRCTRGSLCRYLHEDGGRSSSDRLNRHGADNRERCDRGTAIAHDNKEYLIESKEAAGSSLERFSSGKRSRYDEDREEHHDYRYKKPTVQCINFTRGKCFRGSACKFAHLNAPNDGAWPANDGERERGRGHDRAATHLHSEHDARHEPRRSIPCIFFPEGRCRNGYKCKFSHEGPVQSVPAGKFDEKSASHGSNENASTWKGPRWGDAHLPNVQGNVSGWGGDNIQAICEASYASNSSGSLSQPQGCDAKYSGLHSESQIAFPFKGQHHGNDPSGLPNIPKAQSHYLGSQAPSSISNLGSSSQHPSFGGGQGQNIYSQPSTGEGQYPPLQSVGNVRGTCVSDQSQQATAQMGYAVQSSQENQMSNSNTGGIASSDGVNSNSKNTVTTEQMAQITHISASLAQIFATGQQLPQLYAAHNPNALGVPPMPQFSQPHSLMPMPCAAPAHQPHVDLLSQQHQTSIPSHIIPSFPGVAAISSLIPSNPIEKTFPESAATTRTPVPSLPTIGSDIGDHHGSTNSEWKMNEIKTVEAEERNGLKANDISSHHGKKEQLVGSSEGGGADPDIDKAGGKDMDKDAKGIRMFKYALVDQVKEMLKPIWKEGNMSKEVHKTIVKKVVDKVTGALQFNIPQTEERIDFYMEHSKGKLGKLVQAYVEKYSKV